MKSVLPPEENMDWRLVLSLSLFGLAMAFGTVYVIPPSVEPFIWLAILVTSAVIIARRRPDRPFAHGFATGLMNSVWMTAGHILLYDTFMAGHPSEAEFIKTAPMPPRVMMLLTGPVVGIVTGIIMGGIAAIAVRVRAKRAPA